MNRPCTIYFHEDSAPSVYDLPDRYLDNVSVRTGQGVARMSLDVQRAFLIDFAPTVLRTRVNGTKEESPIDFPMASISHIEWYYGEEVPDNLIAEPHSARGN